MHCRNCNKIINTEQLYGKGIFCNKKCQLAYAYKSNKNYISTINSKWHTYDRIEVKKVCPKCNNVFSVQRLINKEGVELIKKHERKFCSGRCSHTRSHTEAAKEKIRVALTIDPYKKTCINCGKIFYTKKSKQMCCSQSCGSSIANKQRKNIILENGIFTIIDLFNRYNIKIDKPLFDISAISSQGVKYNYAHVKNHPYANKRGCVLEHRAVMELHLNRFLTKGEVVHHKDENGKNNKIENLELMTNTKHCSLHSSKQDKYVILTCPVCKKQFSKRIKELKNTNYCSKYCMYLRKL